MNKFKKRGLIQRALSMMISAAIALSVIPAGAFAEFASVVAVTADSESVLVNTPAEFSYSINANDDAGKNVLASIGFSNSAAVEKCEYKSELDGNWYEFTGVIGDGTPQLLESVLSGEFRVTFNQPGQNTVSVSVSDNETQSILCSSSTTINVLDIGRMETNISESAFIVGESKEFTFTTIANGQAGIMVFGSFVFSDPSAIETLEYKESQDGNWYPFAGDFGPPETGFPFTDNLTSTFRVTFSKPGTYSLTSVIKRADNSEILCTNVSTVVVKDDCELYYSQENVELALAETSYINETLVDGATGAEYTYESSADYIVSVDSNGMLTPNMEGEADITVTRIEGAEYTSKTATYHVRVIKVEYPDFEWALPIPSEIAWNVEGGYINYIVGDHPEGKIQYSISDWNVASINSNTGLLTMNMPGVLEVTATRYDDGKYLTTSNSYILNIVKGQQAPLEVADSTVVTDRNSAVQNAVTGGSTNNALVYEIEDPSVIEIDSEGVITPKRTGVTNVTVTRPGDDKYEDVSITYSVEVILAQQDAHFENGSAEKTIEYGQSFQNAVVNSSTSFITYSSSNPDIATVDQTGAVTTVDSGEVVITATIEGNDVYDGLVLSYNLIINKASQMVEFATAPSQIGSLTFGESFTNAATAATPITYSSSDEEVADVDENGTLIIYKAGEVTITATAVETSKYLEATASYTVIINKASQTITFDKGQDIEIAYNDNGNIFINSASTDAADDDITVTYAVINGGNSINAETFNYQTGEFEITRPGYIVIEAQFGENDRYAQTNVQYRLTVDKDEQEFSFSADSFEVENGDASFVSPVITTEGDGTGNIVYSVSQDDNNVVESINPQTGELTFSSNTGTVTIKATKYADEFYKEVSAKYVLSVVDWIAPADAFSVVGTMGDNGWYTSDVSIVAKEGYLLSYTKGANAQWVESFDNVITTDGTHTVKFYIMQEQTNKISEQKVLEINVDKTTPSASVNAMGMSTWEKLLTIITLGNYDNDTISFTINNSDITSGVDKIEYFVDYGSSTASIDNITGAQWEEYADEIVVDKDKLFVVYAKVTDKAGNYIYATTNGIIFDRTAPDITYRIETANVNGYYDGDVIISLSVTDPTPYSGINRVEYTIMNNGSQTQTAPLYTYDLSGDIQYSELVSQWSSSSEEDSTEGKIIVDKSKNNSDNIVVSIKAVDNSGNERIREIDLSIIADKPQMKVTFENDPAIIETYEGVEYYDQPRTAKVVITGAKKLFEESQAPVINVEAALGETYAGSTYRVGQWTYDDNLGAYVNYVYFEKSAVYDFDVKFVDIFNNECEYSANKFAVDLDAPTAEVSVITNTAWTKLLEVLTFDIWSNEELTVKAVFEDQTSPISSIEYYISDSDRVLRYNDLKNVEWSVCEDALDDYTAEVAIPENEYVSVYFKAVDVAGHVSYFNTDGIIVDSQKGTLTVVPVTSATGEEENTFNGDFDVKISVADSAVSSGISRIEYWVYCDNQPTVNEVIYSFEYTPDEDTTKNTGHLIVKEINSDGTIVTTVDDPEYVLTADDLKYNIEKIIHIDAQKNNGDVVSIVAKAWDNAGNVWEGSYGGIMTDIVAPEIEVSFDNNVCNIVDGRGYFAGDRVATVTYTERLSNFDRQKAVDSIIIKTIDGEKLDVSQMIEWGDTVVSAESIDKTTHTAYITFSEDNNYIFESISYTDSAGNTCAYEDVVFAEDTKAPVNFTVDKVRPTVEITLNENVWHQIADVLTFDLFFRDSFEIVAEADDETSPTTIKYFKTADTALLDEAALGQITDEQWLDYEKIVVNADERLTVYFRITDHAGNYIYANSQGIIFDKTVSDIIITAPQTSITHNGIPVYTEDIDVQINVYEKLDDINSGIKSVEYWVECDNEVTANSTLFSFEYVPDNDLTKNLGDLVIRQLDESGELVTVAQKEDYALSEQDLVKQFTKTITIDSATNNSCNVVLRVRVVDNAGNIREETKGFDIDATSPQISVTFDNNEAYKVLADKGFFPQERTATVVITERPEHFDKKAAADGISITALSASGTSVILDTSRLVSEFKTNGSGNSATHTATIDFSASANYAWSIEYTDLSGRQNNAVDTNTSVTPFMFAVDTDKPTGEVKAGSFGTWRELIRTLTFGLWNNSTVTVTGSCDDVTTPVESFMYFKSSSKTAMTEAELGAVTSWANFTSVTSDLNDMFTIYLKITDSAGNISYISTNGIVVDTSSPNIETSGPNITITPDTTSAINSDDVVVAVNVAEPVLGTASAYSGINHIGYEVYNMGQLTQSGELYSFSAINPSASELTGTWSDNAAFVVDKNLNNSNDVKIVINAIDNAGNSSTNECYLKIDISQPQIIVEYDNNTADASFAESVYFNADRTAKITVLERNFDPENVVLNITNTDGYVPQISGWTRSGGTGNGDNTAHTAYVTFDRDGDYTFDISCTDMAGNVSQNVDYGTSVSPEAFTIDKTAPVVTVTYDNNNALNQNYYNQTRTATITITEHNFETSRIVISLTATDDGTPISLPLVTQWSTNGNVHSALVLYEADARYTFDIEYTDKAGNAISDVAMQTFYVDTTAPVLEISGVIDESANNNDTIGFVMTATDTNFDSFEPVVEVTLLEGGTFVTKTLSVGEFTDIVNGRVYTVENLNADGIYRITCTLFDKAGNAFEEVIRTDIHNDTYATDVADLDSLMTFTVNRGGSVFEIDEKSAEISEKYYIQYVEDDLVFIEINADELKSYEITLNGEALEEGVDYTLEVTTSEGGWMKYVYTINKNLFEQEGEYKIVVSSKDMADNDAFSDVKDASVEFVVDRTAPVVTVSGIAMNGRYQTDKQLVTLIPTDDGGALQSLVVNLVDEDGRFIEELINVSGQELLDLLEENGGKVNLEIEEGLYQNVQIICSDCSLGEAGQTNVSEQIVRNVSVSSSAFMIFWSNKALRFGSIGGIFAIIAAIVVVIVVKKKRS